MISETDSFFTYELGDYFIILPSNWDQSKIDNIYGKKIKKSTSGISYNSGKSNNFLCVEELRKLIKDNLDACHTKGFQLYI